MIERLAVEVLQAHEKSKKLVVQPYVHVSLEEAYFVQNELTKLRLERGDTQIGYKVGCTSRRIQAQMGIHEPIYGRLFEQDRRISPQSIRRGDFDGLAIEGELAVELDRDPSDLPTSRVGMEQCISRVIPVIELHHFGNPIDALNASVLVANNAIHAGFVQSQLDGTTFGTKSETLTIRFDNTEVALVPSEELIGTLLNSLSWLREKLLTEEKSPRLRPPVIVLCGSVAPLFRIAKPTLVDVTFGDHDLIRCSVQ
ncbi:MAG: hypothetical protein OXG25_12885 [Gammaproteobacteria bacterium]|nr:hypothetical protein [Gammaproteobacteria bacterium]